MSHNRHYHRLVSAYETDRLDFSMKGVLAPEGTPLPGFFCGQCAKYWVGGWCPIGVIPAGCKTPTHDVGYLWPACKNFTTETQKTTMETQKTIQATKVCKRCGRELPLEAFGKTVRSKDGYQSNCRECQAELVRQGWEKRRAEGKAHPAPMRKKKAVTAAPVAPNPSVEEMPDHDLVKELRRRGYDVKCTKVIEL